MSDKISIDEAKRNFTEAMEQLAITAVVRRHPLKSVAVAAAAGVAAGLSARSIMRQRFPLLEFAALALRLTLKK